MDGLGVLGAVGIVAFGVAACVVAHVATRAEELHAATSTSACADAVLEPPAAIGGVAACRDEVAVGADIEGERRLFVVIRVYRGGEQVAAEDGGLVIGELELILRHGMQVIMGAFHEDRHFHAEVVELLEHAERDPFALRRIAERVLEPIGGEAPPAFQLLAGIGVFDGGLFGERAFDGCINDGPATVGDERHRGQHVVAGVELVLGKGAQRFLRCAGPEASRERAVGAGGGIAEPSAGLRFVNTFHRVVGDGSLRVRSHAASEQRGGRCEKRDECLDRVHEDLSLALERSMVTKAFLAPSLFLMRIQGIAEDTRSPCRRVAGGSMQRVQARAITPFREGGLRLPSTTSLPPS